jgi:aromatic-L-amino-acid decarboxylase
MRTFGVKGMQAHINRTIKLGDYFADLVRTRPDVFRIFSGPAFALTVIQILPKAKTEIMSYDDHDYAADDNAMAVNELTKKVHEHIFAQGKLFLTSSVISGKYCIRVVSSNPKSEEKYLKNAFDVLLATAEEYR